MPDHSFENMGAMNPGDRMKFVTGRLLGIESQIESSLAFTPQKAIELGVTYVVFDAFMRAVLVETEQDQVEIDLNAALLRGAKSAFRRACKGDYRLVKEFLESEFLPQMSRKGSVSETKTRVILKAIPEIADPFDISSLPTWLVEGLDA